MSSAPVDWSKLMTYLSDRSQTTYYSTVVLFLYVQIIRKVSIELARRMQGKRRVFTVHATSDKGKCAVQVPSAKETRCGPCLHSTTHPPLMLYISAAHAMKSKIHHNNLF